MIKVASKVMVVWQNSVRPLNFCQCMLLRVILGPRWPRLLIVKRHGGSIQKPTLASFPPLQKLADFQTAIQFEVLRRLRRTSLVGQHGLSNNFGVVGLE